MKELSVFIDESGDFGEYSYHAPFYIVTMVFHNQKVDINEDVNAFERELSYLGYPNHCIHTCLLFAWKKTISTCLRQKEEGCLTS